jgi:hypothetical protein
VGQREAETLRQQRHHKETTEEKHGNKILLPVTLVAVAAGQVP